MPPPQRDDVVSFLHNPAHHGFESTLRRITMRFWWPRIRGDVCICSSVQSLRLNLCLNPNYRTSLGQIPTNTPFVVLYIDIVGGQGFLLFGASFKSIRLIINGLTNWAEAFPIKDQRAVNVAHAVYAEWIARCYVSEQIISDRRMQFKSSLLKKLCIAFGYNNTCTKPYRQKANTKCER